MNASLEAGYWLFADRGAETLCAKRCVDKSGLSIPRPYHLNGKTCRAGQPRPLGARFHRNCTQTYELDIERSLDEQTLCLISYNNIK